MITAFLLSFLTFPGPQSCWKPRSYLMFQPIPVRSLNTSHITPTHQSVFPATYSASDLSGLIAQGLYCHMPKKNKTLAIVNGTGRQAASVIRAVTAIGYAVRAQVHSLQGLVAEELAELPNVNLFEGALLNNQVLIDTIFDGAQIAFINTNPLGGDEIKIGKALANAAKKHNIQHFIYSSMPDHSIHNPRWPTLPQWACKFTVENYVRQLGLPSTFVYAGIYNNNFTSLPYPLFCMDFKDNGRIEWRAPFHPDTKLPWLDAEHDVGPAVLQIFKDGPNRWHGHRYVPTTPPVFFIRVPIPVSRSPAERRRYETQLNSGRFFRSYIPPADQHHFEFRQSRGMDLDLTTPHH